jgi:hypothetical protein
MILRWVTLASVGMVAAACGGVSDIGSGADPDGKAGSANGTGATDGMGASNSTGAKGGTGSSNGTGASNMGAAPGTAGKDPGVIPGDMGQCATDLDCPGADKPCDTCYDGSIACYKPYCAAGGICMNAGTTCPTKCATDMDCPVRDVACSDCGDGSKACPTSQCLMGQCQTTIVGCGNVDPCTGLECGAECKACGPDGVCAPMQQPSYCSAEGKCQPGLPQCGGANECKTAMDCGAPPPKCIPCGNDTCATFDCIKGSCVFACPPNPEPQCKVTDDCPVIGEVCKMCPSGKCAVQACLQGSCELVCQL